MNAPNTKWSIVSNALKPVTSALKNAGKWRRNNTLSSIAGNSSGNGADVIALVHDASAATEEMTKLLKREQDSSINTKQRENQNHKTVTTITK